MELECREPTINTPLQHPNRIHDKYWFWFKEHRNWVRRYATNQHWGSMQLRGSMKSRTDRVRPKVGTDRVWILNVWEDEMEMRGCWWTPGSANYILPVTLSTPDTPVSLNTRRWSLQMLLKAVIEGVWSCTSRLRSSELRDAHGGRDWASLGMQLETEMEWTLRCIWRPWLSKFGDALGGRDQVNSEIHFEAIIEHLGRYTWRPWLIKIGGVRGGDWSEEGQSGRSQSGGSESGGGQSGGGSLGVMCDGNWDSIHWLTHNCGNVQNWVQQGPLRAGRLAGSRRQSILGWCSMWCLQYSVYVVLTECCIRCMLYSVYAVLGVCCTWC